MRQSSSNWVTNVILTVGLFLARPGAFGEHFGICYLAAAILLICFSLFKNGLKDFSFREGVFLISAFALYWGYRIFQTLGQGHAEAIPDIMKGFVFEAVTIAMMVTFLAEEERKHSFFVFYSGVLALLGFSSMISEILSWLGQSGAISLYTFKRTASDNSMEMVLQFPFSFNYGEYHGRSAVTLYRYSGGFIEAGIYPAFACWAIAYSALSPVRSPWIIAGCLIGIVATFSTAAILCVSVMIPALSLALLIRSSRLGIALKAPMLIIIVILIPIIASMIYLMPDIGLADKTETHGVSITDRGDNILRAVYNLPTNMLGRFTREDHQSICLLAASYRLGLLGLMLWLLKFCSCIWSRENDFLKVFACLAPLLFTLAVSQPLFDAMPAVIVLFFTRFQRINVNASSPSIVSSDSNRQFN